MSIAEKLIQIAENELKVYEAGKQSVYETIVFAQDLQNAEQAYRTFFATMTAEEKIVMFVNKAWTGLPNADTVNNRGLIMMCVNNEYHQPDTKLCIWVRFRDGKYYFLNYTNDSYAFIISAGDEWLRVVLL